MKNWRKWLKGVGATIVAVPTLLLAIWYSQPEKPLGNPAPIIQMASAETAMLMLAYTTTVDGVQFEVEAGFVYDGATIPRATWTALGLTPFSGVLARGALLHDWLYRTHRVTRERADELLYLAILADGCEPHKARAVYEAVRDWGWQAWDEGRD